MLFLSETGPWSCRTPPLLNQIKLLLFHLIFPAFSSWFSSRFSSSLYFEATLSGNHRQAQGPHSLVFRGPHSESAVPSSKAKCRWINSMFRSRRNVNALIFWGLFFSPWNRHGQQREATQTSCLAVRKTAGSLNQHDIRTEQNNYFCPTKNTGREKCSFEPQAAQQTGGVNVRR